MNTTIKNDIITIKNLSVYYGEKKAVDSVSMSFKEKQVAAVIGPSGCGKSTLLRCINRMNDFVDGVNITGEVLYNGTNIYDKSVDVADIRRKIGMVFQKPNPFPKSIYKNIIWGPVINGYDCNMDELVETSLKRAALWDEVKDRLHSSALDLSGGQQQRLCIARTIAMSPDVILMDEPCSALDPKSTAKIEDLIDELRNEYAIIVVTHNMQQAARISKKTAFFYEGVLVEDGFTKEMFIKPELKRTEDYIMGRFG